MQLPPPPFDSQAAVDARPDEPSTPTSSEFGYSLAATGDVDGDGSPEVAIGHHGVSGRYVWLVSGRSGEPLRLWHDEHEWFGDALAGVATADAVGALAIASVGRAELRAIASGALTWHRELSLDDFEASSPSLCALADVDGDATEEVVAGVSLADAPDAPDGRVLVLSGRDGSTLLELAGYFSDTGLGVRVADVGDVDRDGTS